MIEHAEVDKLVAPRAPDARLVLFTLSAHAFMLARIRVALQREVTHRRIGERHAAAHGSQQARETSRRKPIHAARQPMYSPSGLTCLGSLFIFDKKVRNL